MRGVVSKDTDEAVERRAAFAPAVPLRSRDRRLSLSGGQVLDTRYGSVTRGHLSVQYSSPAACAGCQIKARCTTGRWQRINRGEHEAVIERMATRLAKRLDILVIRKSTVEHPFGSIKQ
ncbi:hypothetical protein [Sphingomonas mollis]|uniref:Transposase DDE domain-containing protein n=1 Tax=Sphingomonas mollis TaxID=2795726 RepID=A0ABS0XUT9_9SPHN|nr:hypothetical protein [Sphingomonas sp. BT553]MBJ6123513.1 hypothetical protein [Sphingomonas sp. BT553]